MSGAADVGNGEGISPSVFLPCAESKSIGGITPDAVSSLSTSEEARELVVSTRDELTGTFCDACADLRQR